MADRRIPTASLTALSQVKQRDEIASLRSRLVDALTAKGGGRVQMSVGAEPPPLLEMEVGRTQSTATDDSDNVGGDAQGLIEANSSLRLQVENLKAVMAETDNKVRIKGGRRAGGATAPGADAFEKACAAAVPFFVAPPPTLRALRRAQISDLVQELETTQKVLQDAELDRDEAYARIESLTPRPSPPALLLAPDAEDGEESAWAKEAPKCARPRVRT